MAGIRRPLLILLPSGMDVFTNYPRYRMNQALQKKSRYQPLIGSGRNGMDGGYGWHDTTETFPLMDMILTH